MVRSVPNSTPTFHQLCSSVMLKEASLFIYQLDTKDSVIATQKFLMETPKYTLPDPGIETRTSYSAVALATTRPTSSLIVMFLSKVMCVVSGLRFIIVITWGSLRQE